MTASDDTQTRKPCGELMVRIMSMPADTNRNGDIFGGWLLGQMDMAGEIYSSKHAQNRTVTVAIDSMAFRKPVNVGDVVCIYADLLQVGRTSVTINIEAWVIRRFGTTSQLVTEGRFTYVAINADGTPTPIEKTA